MLGGQCLRFPSTSLRSTHRCFVSLVSFYSLQSCHIVQSTMRSRLYTSSHGYASDTPEISEYARQAPHRKTARSGSLSSCTELCHPRTLSAVDSLTPVLSGSTCTLFTLPSSTTRAYRLLRGWPNMAVPSKSSSSAFVSSA